MIDERTRAAYEVCKTKALRDGLDLLEVMDRAGLIRTENSINGDWAACLERLLMNLDQQPVTALVQLGGGQNTPLDAKRGVVEYIDFFLRQFRSQSGRPV